MGVILTDDVTDHARRFLVGAAVRVGQVVHRKEDAAMDRLEAITCIRQGPANNNAHRVINIGGTHLLADIDVFDPLGNYYCFVIHLDIQVANVHGVLFDKLSTGRDLVAHQYGKHLVGACGPLDHHLEQLA